MPDRGRPTKTRALTKARLGVLLGTILGLAPAAALAQQQPSTPGKAARPGPALTFAGAAKPDVFGTSQISYVTIPEWEFVTTDSSHAWGDKADNNNFAQKYPKEPWELFIAGPKLPSGARLTYLEFDYCDDNPNGSNDLALYLLDVDFEGNLLPGTIGSILTSGAPGCTYDSVDLTPAGYTVDNFTRRLMLMVTTGSNADSTTRFSGVIIGYKLQVSPPPGLATFGDVPTNDPLFQYVEALAASGITAGCGGGNFCPNSPLTRGQMAVFLAKALGLEFH
jgi:hypothetical protein